MKFVLFVVSTIIVLVTTQLEREDFFQASQACFTSQRMPGFYRAQFYQFEYPDQPQVHRFIYCVANTLNVWNDTSGFNVDKINQMYRNRANSTILTPIVTQCNQRRNSWSKQKWCYNAFQCLLRGPIGQWFRQDQRGSSGNRS